ncbi:MAG: VWA domain-containing protein [Deltaproteobacteria bacterium]|nr:MAG: VWA domain-containing protein [Deltaproteobacteria bacterium]
MQPTLFRNGRVRWHTLLLLALFLIPLAGCAEEFEEKGEGGKTFLASKHKEPERNIINDSKNRDLQTYDDIQDPWGSPPESPKAPAPPPPPARKRSKPLDGGVVGGVIGGVMPASEEKAQAFGNVLGGVKGGAGTLAQPAKLTARRKTAPPPATPSLAKDAYYENTYQGGRGSKERIEKLINSGVTVDGRQIRLEAFTHDYTQNFPIPIDRAISLSAGLERTRILTDGGKTYLQIGLQSIASETPRRPPLNIALVLDVSGSMASEGKIEAARAAARSMLDHLTPEDTVSIITYSDSARTFLPPTHIDDRNRHVMKARINQIRTGGGTNIYGGLTLGYEAVMNNFTEAGVNLVILLSDGLVTVGRKDPQSFRRLADRYFQKEVQTTTIGVGIQFDDTLMMDLAKAGKGNYHFVKDSASVEEIFRTELEDLKHLVARAVKVRVVFPEEIRLTKVFGSRQLAQAEVKKVRAEEQRIDERVYEELGIVKDREKDEPGTKIFIPHFFLNDSHVIMMEVEVPPGMAGKDRLVAEVFLKYKDLVFHKNEERSARVAIHYTNDRKAMIASIDRGVKKNLLGFETGEVLLRAADAIAQRHLTDAIRMIDERMVVVGVAAKEWQDEELERDGQLLARYRDVLASLTRDQLARADLGRYIEKSLTFAGYQRSQ